MEEKIIELDTLILPTTSGYTAYCEEDVDEISRRFEKELYESSKDPEELKVKVRVNIYSPKRLQEWDYPNIKDSFYTNLHGYRGSLGHYECRLTEAFKLAGLIDTGCLVGMALEDLLRETYLKSLTYIALSSSIFFWGAFIFLPATVIPLFGSLRHRKKARSVKRFLDRIGEVNFVEGESERKREMVRKAREHFLEIYDKDKSKLKHCEEMDAYLKGQGYNTKFYSEIIKDIKSTESHFTLYLPESFRRRVKNLIKTFLVPAPKCIKKNLGWLGDKI